MSDLSASRILRGGELAKRLGISRVTLWRWARQGIIPKGHQIGPNTVGWLESEIDDWWTERFGKPPAAEAT